MKPANICPCGIVSVEDDSSFLTVPDEVGSDGVRAGVHSNTNMYMEPSNND